jgi:tetratricopeptide (TPR) repeat protein
MRLGAVLKKLKRNADAIAEFMAAEYFMRTLGRADKVKEVALNLGKLYFDTGQFEASIRYRDELVKTHEASGEHDGAASFATLVANTYDAKLARPADAANYYRLALSFNAKAKQLDEAFLQQRLKECDARAGEAGKSLWTALLECEASADSAERTAARLALAVDFNLWTFEPRSFGAWYERVFGGTVSYPTPADPQLPIWPFAAIYQLLDLARCARELHRHADSLMHARTAERVARSFGIVQGEYLAAQMSSTVCAELGRNDLAAEHRARALTIKTEFDAAATTRGLQAQKVGDKILTPWNFIGLQLALNVRQIPDVSTRHTVVKGRLVDEFLMSAVVESAA